MSCYDGNPFGSLYDTGEAKPEEQQTVAASVPVPSASDGVLQAVEVISDPVSLVEAAVTPGETKLPWGLAVLGACVVAVIFANSLDGKR